jgi:hypothetical protein
MSLSRGGALNSFERDASNPDKTGFNGIFELPWLASTNCVSTTGWTQQWSDRNPAVSRNIDVALRRGGSRAGRSAVSRGPSQAMECGRRKAAAWCVGPWRAEFIVRDLSDGWTDVFADSLRDGRIISLLKWLLHDRTARE